MAGWQITWGKSQWTEDDLTGQHLMLIVTAQGADQWEQCDPTGGPVRLIGVLAALIAIAESRPIEKVIVELALLPASVLVGCIGPRPDEDEEEMNSPTVI